LRLGQGRARSRDNLRGQLASQAHAKALTLKLEIRKTVLGYELHKVAQLVHVERRVWATQLTGLLLLLLRLSVTAAASSTLTASLPLLL
jgi:hypothetical protein